MGSTGTPFITLLEPSPLTGYNRLAPASEQPPTVPKAFLDAMTVRQRVFVEEQGVPMENEFDPDDRRSCHWVAYASVKHTVEPEVRDPATGAVLRPPRSETTTVPVGTLRLVPFPHDPHPTPGASYVDGKPVAPPAADDPGTARPTHLHDGVEPYVKLGRLAVVPEFRGYRIASLLVRTALEWARAHPAYFVPSAAAGGLRSVALDRAGGPAPKWHGLVCCHAQQQVVPTWERLGFKVDGGMGTWHEEGIPHAGMFQRLKLEQKQ